MILIIMSPSNPLSLIIGNNIVDYDPHDPRNPDLSVGD
jgi:hypothetical protein